MLALAQARGGIAFCVVPLHCAYTYTQYAKCQEISFAGGICARRRRRDSQSLHGITDMDRNPCVLHFKAKFVIPSLPPLFHFETLGNLGERGSSPAERP